MNPVWSLPRFANAYRMPASRMASSSAVEVVYVGSVTPPMLASRGRRVLHASARRLTVGVCGGLQAAVGRDECVAGPVIARAHAVGGLEQPAEVGRVGI